MFCIWCGSPTDGDVALRCTSCGRTHYLNSKISASALTVAGDNYLTVKRAAPPELGKWDLPGGFCEYGEDPADTAARETIEESGIKVAVSRLLGVFMDEYIEPDGRPWPTINLIYLATPDNLDGDSPTSTPKRSLHWRGTRSPIRQTTSPSPPSNSAPSRRTSGTAKALPRERRGHSPTRAVDLGPGRIVFEISENALAVHHECGRYPPGLIESLAREAAMSLAALPPRAGTYIDRSRS